MDEQISLLHDALRRPAPGSGAVVDISVSRQYGDNTVTMRAQMPVAGSAAPPPKRAPLPRRDSDPASSVNFAPTADRLAPAAIPSANSGGGIERANTSNSYVEESEVNTLLAEIDRLKRKALSRGVNLTSPQEDVPAEDVATLRRIFAIADDDSSGEISKEQLGQMHVVMGEPLTEEELNTAFKAMDWNKSNTVSFDDFLGWYTLAHSSSGMLSKKGSSYTSRFSKMMNRLSSLFDVRQLSTATTGAPGSLDFRVQFHYNDGGQLKQISPWHDIPLFSTEGLVHMITEIPKFSRAKFEIATGEPLNPIKQDTKNGKLREYKYGDMCFNYGAFPQTWEDPKHTSEDTGFVGDNDPIDAIEIGYRILRTGSVTKVKVLGCLAMIDDGETDWKVLCIAADDPLASKLNDIEDVERVLPGYTSCIREWLRMYKTVDGKPENQFALAEKACGREYTMRVINETHSFWERLTATGAKTV
jgi:inorganic pyrophosphatase